MKALKFLIAAVISATALAQPAAALEPLPQEKYINDRLIAARIADRAVILQRGETVWNGPVNDLTSDLTERYLGV